MGSRRPAGPSSRTRATATSRTTTIVDEGHRLLTYILPASASITVLTASNPQGGPFPATAITASQLAELVAGKKPVKLWEGLDTGFWMHVHVDTVCSLAQQYHPSTTGNSLV